MLPGVPVLSGTISVTGAHAITAGFTTNAVIGIGGTQTPAPAGSTCADYARGFPITTQSGGGTGFFAPVLHTDGFENIYISASVRGGYTGPGRYSSGQAPSLVGKAIVGVGNPGNVVYEDYASAPGTKVLTVGPDGAGTLEFSDWRPARCEAACPVWISPGR